MEKRLRWIGVILLLLVGMGGRFSGGALLWPARRLVAHAAAHQTQCLPAAPDAVNSAA
jgi:hypothetical protein